ncbi:MAG: dockerin type I repeat-containing protein, partial [Oscillospiraceae bacterium]|nr:dockerin type I repeat-containing protein [Oscillospiraceae bacterium]
AEMAEPIYKASDSDKSDVLIGDVDASGTIDVSDLTELSLALIGDKELTEDQQKAADIDGDRSVTLADLARLQQYLSKKIDKL